ncbi:MAG: hypothetical protein LBH47_00355 [Christensenellaceae bacterium]|jgi:hypothetical protein|nr:hypothetical protein [Christensenellaceae bacterium]
MQTLKTIHEHNPIWEHPTFQAGDIYTSKQKSNGIAERINHETERNSEQVPLQIPDIIEYLSNIE